MYGTRAGRDGLAGKVLASAMAGHPLDEDAVGVAFVDSGISGTEGDAVVAACRDAYASLASRGLPDVALGYARAATLLAIARMDEPAVTA